MKWLGLIIGALSAVSATASHAQYKLEIDMHGERGTYGALDVTFFDVLEDGSGTPSGAYFSTTPYYSSQIIHEFVPASQFSVSYQFGGSKDQGQLISYDYINKLDNDSFQLSFDQDPTSPYYDEAKFTANIDGHTIFANPDESPFEGGFVNYSVSSAPEPTVWGILFTGIGVMGTYLRRRRLKDRLPAPQSV